MAKYNRDKPLPSSDPMFKKGTPVNERTTGVMTAEQAKARKQAYQSQTGMKYVPKSANNPVAAPKRFASEADKQAWFAKNAPERMTKKKKK